MDLPQPQISRKRLRSIATIVSSIIGFVASLITILLLLPSTIFSWLVTEQGILIPVAFFLLGALVASIAIIATNIFYSRSFPGRWLLRGYRWVSAEYLYCIEDDTLEHHSQTITIVLSATRSGVNLFENKYSWTGQGNEESPKVLSSGHELMGSITKQEFYYGYKSWKYYYIYLGHELTPGEEERVIIKQELYDQGHKFQRFLAKTITEPIKSLKLRVLIPENHPPKKLFNYELNHPEPNSQILSRVPSRLATVRHNGKVYEEISYEISKPRLGRRYEIRWEW